MRTQSKQNTNREQMITFLIQLESGKISEQELLIKHGITSEDLKQWRDQNPLKDTISSYSSQNKSRFGNVFWILAVVDILIIFVLHKYADASVKDLLAMPLLVVFCVAVLGLTYQDVERGMVRVGKYRRIRRSENPFAFWLLISVQTVVMLAFLGAVAMVIYRG